MKLMNTLKIDYFTLVLLFLANIAAAGSDLIFKNGMESPHLKYFGFTLIDTYWDDPTDAVNTTNYSDEVSKFSNIADILVLNPTDNIIDRINAMDALQMKSILHLNEIFYEWVGTSSPSGADYDLRADYQSRWNLFVNTNQLVTNQNKIQSFYLGEEPTWNGISFEDLESASNYIKSSVATVPIMLIEAYPVIAQLQIPESVDWIGFDHYFIKNPNTDGVYLNELSLLKSKFTTADQKLVIIMDAHYIELIHGDLAGIELNEMGNVANNYYQLALNETRAIALLGYFWPSGFDVSSSIGARNMPEAIKQNYIRIGKQITNK